MNREKRGKKYFLYSNFVVKELDILLKILNAFIAAIKCVAQII